jgi:transglutaminase-like putative cysteine protease
MRLRIDHSMAYRYDPPALGAIQVLRLTPRNYEGQYVVRWRIDVTADARLDAHEDAFGNITHVFTAEGPFSELTVAVDGQVETQNIDGVVRGTVERFPPSLFLRDTSLTAADEPIRAFAKDLHAAGGGEVLATLHALLDRLHADMKHDSDNGQGAPHATTIAPQAFARMRGAAQDLAHIFISAARSLAIPARYVSGYYGGGGGDEDSSVHAWAEAHVPGLGWVGFDPAHGLCPTDAHVRVAIGLDALGAAPVRGTRYGVGAEIAAVAIKVGQ